MLMDADRLALLNSRSFDNTVAITRCRPGTCTQHGRAAGTDESYRELRWQDTHVTTFRSASTERFEVTTRVFLIPSIDELCPDCCSKSLRPKIAVPPALDAQVTDVDIVDMTFCDWTPAKAREACVNSAFGMQNMFDLHIVQWKNDELQKHDMAVIGTLYVFCIRAAVYHAEDADDPHLRQLVRSHRIHTEQKRDNLTSVDGFFAKVQAETKMVDMNAFKVSRLQSFLRLATSVGVAILVGLYSKSRPFCGIDVLGNDSRLQNVIDVVDIVVKYKDKFTDDAYATLQTTMLHGEQGIRRALCMERMHGFTGQTAPRGAVTCEACDGLNMHDLFVGNMVACHGVGCCVDCYMAKTTRHDDIDHLAITKALTCVKLLSRNMELAREHNKAAAELVANAGKASATHKADATALRDEVAVLKKKLREEKRKARKKAPDDACQPADRTADEEARCDPCEAQSVAHAIILRDNDATHAAELAAIRTECESQARQLRAENNELKELHARDLMRLERRHRLSLDTELCACVEEIRVLEGDVVASRAFDDTRNDMICVQRKALLGNAIEQNILTEEVQNLEKFGSTTMHLNSIWREKYAFASGEAKATKLLFASLCDRLPSLKA
tara:strand:- start:51 stop:1895 length:1845 start_codon:yes stop_codon:yes gene_type:complete